MLDLLLVEEKSSITKMSKEKQNDEPVDLSQSPVSVNDKQSK